MESDWTQITQEDIHSSKVYQRVKGRSRLGEQGVEEKVEEMMERVTQTVNKYFEPDHKSDGVTKFMDI